MEDVIGKRQAPICELHGIEVESCEWEAQCAQGENIGLPISVEIIEKGGQHCWLTSVRKSFLTIPRVNLNRETTISNYTTSKPEPRRLCFCAQKAFIYK